MTERRFSISFLTLPARVKLGSTSTCPSPHGAAAGVLVDGERQFSHLADSNGGHTWPYHRRSLQVRLEGAVITAWIPTPDQQQAEAKSPRGEAEILT